MTGSIDGTGVRNRAGEGRHSRRGTSVCPQPGLRAARWARLIRATDLRLSPRDGEWVLDTVDTGPRPHLLPGLPGHRKRVHLARDWQDFEPLIGPAGTAKLRGPFARIRRLKPAQIADLLEQSSRKEETEILGRVHAYPELEADVFGELDDDLAARLLGARTNPQIATVLARMHAP